MHIVYTAFILLLANKLSSLIVFPMKLYDTFACIQYIQYWSLFLHACIVTLDRNKNRFEVMHFLDHS